MYKHRKSHKPEPIARMLHICKSALFDTTELGVLKLTCFSYFTFSFFFSGDGVVGFIFSAIDRGEMFSVSLTLTLQVSGLVLEWGHTLKLKQESKSANYFRETARRLYRLSCLYILFIFSGGAALNTPDTSP